MIASDTTATTDPTTNPPVKSRQPQNQCPPKGANGRFPP